MNGSPGASPMFALFTENGPCHVNPNLTTSENPWSWNQQYNVLYLDQPVQTGFSYNVPFVGTLDLTTAKSCYWTQRIQRPRAQQLSLACLVARMRAKPRTRHPTPPGTGQNLMVADMVLDSQHRDFACNWVGGERSSLSVNYAKSDEFQKAGYADVSIDTGSPVGQIRQHG
ncbi:uncharacterized protein ATNIH1004_005152 [Aspergillus tanneri]|uniref:carboxypeptidase C n=1 Tax=Aspergillus tanneri TaxID=1220188 RepID=A0A5M9MTI7_9EURO|nr:uncharacterized protein ATNIH1004_005152 [Aspergillus tanneri]KAA8649256.1 hypothetical protein ATNIH1004_005152 [Aspergillus tanneri]